jgi:hypothetical protein
MKFKNYVAELGMVVQDYNPSTWKAEAGGLVSSRQAWAVYKARPCFKTNNCFQTNNYVAKQY